MAYSSGLRAQECLYRRQAWSNVVPLLNSSCVGIALDSMSNTAGLERTIFSKAGHRWERMMPWRREMCWVRLLVFVVVASLLELELSGLELLPTIAVVGEEIMVDGCFGRMKLRHMMAMEVVWEEKLFVIDCWMYSNFMSRLIVCFWYDTKDSKW